MKRVLLRTLGLVLALAVIAPAAYALVALVLALIPMNADFEQAQEGIPIYVRTNGVHAELVLPARREEADWTALLPASDMRRLSAPLGWVAFGWGDAEFFTNTPTWADLKPRTALLALTGLGEGAMHVEYLADPAAYAGRELRLTPTQYARLVEYVRGSFAPGADGRPVRLPAPGYFDRDAFYAARQHYTAWHTSNEWVRRGLNAAGVRVPVWAPFDSALFFQLRDV